MSTHRGGDLDSLKRIAEGRTTAGDIWAATGAPARRVKEIQAALAKELLATAASDPGLRPSPQLFDWAPQHQAAHGLRPLAMAAPGSVLRVELDEGDRWVGLPVLEDTVSPLEQWARQVAAEGGAEQDESHGSFSFGGDAGPSRRDRVSSVGDDWDAETRRAAATGGTWGEDNDAGSSSGDEMVAQDQAKPKIQIRIRPREELLGQPTQQPGADQLRMSVAKLALGPPPAGGGFLPPPASRPL